MIRTRPATQQAGTGEGQQGWLTPRELAQAQQRKNHPNEFGSDGQPIPNVDPDALAQRAAVYRDHTNESIELVAKHSIETTRSLDGKTVLRIKLPSAGFLPNQNDLQIYKALETLAIVGQEVDKGNDTFLEIQPDDVKVLLALTTDRASVTR
jgi:hypothetical protein